MDVTSDEFSFRTRATALKRFREETFDLFIIGGGITGAAVARDATSRGLKVALVERKDFAFGTSSRSSKLIHGGLRYLQNLEFGLVFEALAERSLLLKTVPHMVRPMQFYLPVYRGDVHGKALLKMGLWLYDILALLRAPGFHRSLTRNRILSEIPGLRSEGLQGGFKYYDASMWDDVLAIETLRSAYRAGAAVANYVEAVHPTWEEDRITGFHIRDLEETGAGASSSQNMIHLRAHRTVVCAGPWTDQIGQKVSSNWQRWLNPSKGIHLIFDLKRIPVPGAMVMTNPDDGRISFVMPRPDYGAGVVIVGTTDGPTDDDPEKAEIRPEDVQYLLNLLQRYFPDLKLTASDILSGYVGVRPLMGGQTFVAQNEKGQEAVKQAAHKNSSVLQKVSREHHIARGPGGTVIVAGGKYTTHRKMAEEIVDFTLKQWKKDDREKHGKLEYPKEITRPNTRVPLNPMATEQAVERCREAAAQKKMRIPPEILSRYGAEALSIMELESEPYSKAVGSKDPEGFPCLGSQLKFAIRSEMAMHLEDFYIRRIPLYATRKDHGLPWASALAKVWAKERGLDESAVKAELARLEKEIAFRTRWQQSVKPASPNPTKEKTMAR